MRNRHCRNAVALLLALALGLAAPAEASLFRTGAPSASGYVGPGDITTFTSWWGLRCFNRAKATGSTNVAKITRASDSTSRNIVCLTNGQFDTATASSFCNATTCVVSSLYDQVGTNDATTNIGTFPALIFNCFGAYPCMKGNHSTTQLRGTTNITPATGSVTQYLVGNTYMWASGGVVGMFSINGGAVTCVCLTHEQLANRWDLSNNGNVFTASANDAAWHVGIGLSTTNADMIIDGTDHTATLSSLNASAGPTEFIFGDSTGVVGMETEEYGWVDNTVWTHSSAGTTACLVAHNAGTFYGITVGGSC